MKFVKRRKRRLGHFILNSANSKASSISTNSKPYQARNHFGNVYLAAS